MGIASVAVKLDCASAVHTSMPNGILLTDGLGGLVWRAVPAESTVAKSLHQHSPVRVSCARGPYWSALDSTFSILLLRPSCHVATSREITRRSLARVLGGGTRAPLSRGLSCIPARARGSEPGQSA